MPPPGVWREVAYQALPAPATALAFDAMTGRVWCGLETVRARCASLDTSTRGLHRGVWHGLTHCVLCRCYCHCHCVRAQGHLMCMSTSDYSTRVSRPAHLSPVVALVPTPACVPAPALCGCAGCAAPLTCVCPLLCASQRHAERRRRERGSVWTRWPGRGSLGCERRGKAVRQPGSAARVHVRHGREATPQPGA